MRRWSRGHLCHLPTITDPGSGRAGFKSTLDLTHRGSAPLSKTAGAPSPCFLEDTSSFTASCLHATCGHHCSTVAHTVSWLLSLSSSPPSSGMCEQPCSQVHRGHSSVQHCRDQAIPTGPLYHQLLLRPSRAPEVSAPHLLASTSCSHWFRPPLPPSQGVAVTLQPVPSSTCGH